MRRWHSTMQQGFSLIEVSISIGILMTLTLAVSTMLRGGFDLQASLSQRAKVLQRLSVAINKISHDVEHTFYVAARDQLRNGVGRRLKTAFIVEKSGGGDKLKLTTRTHQSRLAGSPESDLTYVVYELRESRTQPGRKTLFRGEYPYIPDDLKEDPSLQVLARDIKSLNLEAWIGDRWSQDAWDTNNGESRGKLPRMIRVTIEAYAEARSDSNNTSDSDSLSEKLTTVVAIADAAVYPELKQQNSSIKWSNL